MSPDPYPHHIPQFHLRLPRGYLNDPNGPVELDGTTHLYFQSRPFPDLRVPVEWGHASTRDLVSWTLHRPAMAPVPGGLDSGGCWSGNTVVRGGQIHAYYSGKVDHSPYQSVLRARSTDGGMTFTQPAQMVADPAPEEGVWMFRDPFVYPDGQGWSMVVGAAYQDGPGVRRYRSGDGEHWEFVGDLVRLPRSEADGVDLGEGWECPQVLPTGEGLRVLVASWTASDGIGQVLALDPASPTGASVFDHGQNFYAASVMWEGSRGPLVWGWITEGRERDWWCEAGWAGALSLPRVTWVDGSATVCSRPADAVDSLRVSRLPDGAQLGGQVEIVIERAVTGTARVEFGPGESLVLRVDREAGTCTLDRSAASTDPRAHSGQITIPHAFDPSADLPDLRVFLDGSIVEIFTSGGRSATTRVYPTAAPPYRMSGYPDAVYFELAPALSVAGGD